MARQERPLNPAEGPLQAFAHDLRLLRAQAGNPTYRALARSAGYSATTLSQAAGGMRKPTLEVAVAYVGACGGDVEAWRRRWWELGDTPNESTTPAPPTPPPAPATPNPSASAAPPSPPEPAVNPARAEIRSWSRGQRIGVVIAALATIAGSTTATVLAVSAATRDQSTATSQTQISAQERGCPPLSPSAVFTGETYGFGARVYRGASRDEPILRTIPAGCVIGLVGHCLGEAMKDATSGTPDVRWFVLDSGGVVPSGVVHGNPPSDLPLSRCPNDRPMPSAITLGVGRTPNSRALRLTAAGVHVDIVGFAVLHADDPALPEQRRWQQIAMTPVGASEFTAIWDPRRTRNTPDAKDSVLLVAAACLGGQGPTDVVSAMRVRVGSPDQAEPVTLDAGDRSVAARAACVYPRSG